MLVLKTNEIGVVIAQPKLIGGEFWYDVQTANRRDRILEEDLGEPPTPDADLASLAKEGKWGRLQAVRCALGLERISNTNQSTIYSYQAQRILFQAHQYKPLLKLLDSPDRRLLIADEVGVGKTIEAGVILTELQARGAMDRVLVVCPSRLRQKWANELNRKFGQDFEILDTKGLRERVARVVEKPDRTRFHGIISTQTMRSPTCRHLLTDQLGYVDLVIMDEAHHARNRETSTSHMLRDLCEVSGSVVLLTATPLQLRNADVYTLLNALRPTEFSDQTTFENDMNHFAPVHRAGAIARSRQVDSLPEIADTLREVFSKSSSLNDPIAEQIIESCADQSERTRREWIDLENSIQNLHPLGSIITRTRKREVDEKAPARLAKTIQCDFTADEDEAYQRLVDGTGHRGWSNRRLNLGEIQRARQAASCLPAAYLSKLMMANDEDSDESIDLVPSELKKLGAADATQGKFTRSLPQWEGADSKLAKLIELLDELWIKEPDAKVIVFAFFKGTVRYLEQKLLERGVSATRIDGDVVSDPKNPEKDERGRRIRDFETDPHLKVLLSTEVGSEGLDFQFCHVLVNYDLPWNPMVVEQRIGRIDRFGQKSDVVQIMNLVVRGTIEDEILSRLYDRIGIFERSIGVTEAILGETMTELQKSFVRGELTPEESKKKVDQAADVIINNEKSIESLQEEATELIGHENHIRDEIQRIQKLGRYVSEESIYAIIETYFEQHHPRVGITKDGDRTFAFTINDDLRREIHLANVSGSLWIDRSKNGILRATTSGEIAFHHPELELINASHPLMKAAVKAIGEQMEESTARIGAGRVAIDPDDNDIHRGTYTIALFAHDVDSIRARRILEPVAWHEKNGIVDSNVAERLLFLAMEYGEEADDTSQLHPLSEEGWEAIDQQIIESNGRLRANEKRENQARYVRRRWALDAEYNHKLKAKQQRFDTAKANNNLSMLPAMQGQITKATAEYQRRLQELESMKSVTASISEPLAICILEVEDA